MSGPSYARVVVDVRPAHLDRPFDYRIPEGWDVRVGHRVRVPFAGRRRDGWVVGTGDDTDAARVVELAQQPGRPTLFDEADLRLYRWVADRWAAPMADVLRHALPPRVADVEREEYAGGPARSPGSEPADGQREAWARYDAGAMLDAMPAQGTAPAFWLRPLPGDETALGVDLVGRTLAAGRSAVVLAPDPASPLLEAVRRLAGAAVADLRAAGGDRARYRSFLRARAGAARVVIGERGAALSPVADLGLLLVEDEANPAYKERRSPRHHARDVALARARMAGATAVLTGDLPSAALWRLLGQGHVQAVRAARDIERRMAPRVEAVDVSGSRTRLSAAAGRALGRAVDEGRAAVVLAARGGEGAALVCQQCRRLLACPVCDGSLRPRKDSDERECPACDWSGPATACECGSERSAPLAAGAGRLAAEIRRGYPAAEVVRMEGFDAEGPRARPAIGVMTRGSVVGRPRWLAGERAAVVVIHDADAMRGRPAVEASEDALRLWMAAARAADRVVVQTRDPRDPAVQALVRWDPDGFWDREAERRAALGFPPARSVVRVRAPRAEAAEIAALLTDVLVADEVLGPDLEGAVLVKTRDLRGTLRVLKPLREDWGRANRGIRVDVDPVPIA